PQGFFRRRGLAKGHIINPSREGTTSVVPKSLANSGVLTPEVRRIIARSISERGSSLSALPRWRAGHDGVGDLPRRRFAPERHRATHSPRHRWQLRSRAPRLSAGRVPAIAIPDAPSARVFGA